MSRFVMAFLFYLFIYLFCHGFSSKEQVPFNFMSAVTVCSDFGAQENKICHCFYFSPIHLPWDWMPCSFFIECWVLSQVFHSPLSSSSKGSLVTLHFLPLECRSVNCMCAKLIESCPTLGTPWTATCQYPQSMGFSRQEHWSGLPCLPPEDLLPRDRTLGS